MSITPKTKIALVATVTDFGGAERVVLSLLEHIDVRRFDLVPIFFTTASQQDNAFFKQTRKMERACYTFYVNQYKPKYLNPLINVMQAYRLLKQTKCDVIHSHGYRSNIIGICLAKILRLPSIATCHGYISTDGNLRVYNFLDRLMMRFSSKIIAVSGALKQDLLKSGIQEKRVITIENAVQANYTRQAFIAKRAEKRALLGIHHDEFIVGYVGRLSTEKGVNHLIDAICSLRKTGTAARALIIGDGPQRNELERMAQRNGLGDHILFTGFQSDIPSWLPSLDIFVLPSLTEGTPMALLEAMAAGVPVVASRVGGVPKLIAHGINGYLFDAGNSVELAGLLSNLLKKPDIGNAMAEEALRVVDKRYALSEWCAAIQAQYDLVVKKTRETCRKN